MKRDEIVLLINRILKDEIKMDINKVELHNTLEELGIDSISFMMLIVHVENRLSIEIDMIEGLDEEFSKLTIDMLVNVISGRLDQKKLWNK